MPIVVCYCLGYCISCISPSVIVPGCMGLDARGYGRSKGIASSLIAAGTFDDILCIVLFGLCETLAFAGKGGSKKNENAGKEVGMIILEVVTGFGIGILFGLAGWFFKYLDHLSYVLWLKCGWCVAFAIATILASTKSGFTESKFICALFFGYTNYRIWGEKKPYKELATVWWYI